MLTELWKKKEADQQYLHALLSFSKANISGRFKSVSA